MSDCANETITCGSCSCVVIHHTGGMDEIEINTWENIPAECPWIGKGGE